LNWVVLFDWANLAPMADSSWAPVSLVFGLGGFLESGGRGSALLGKGGVGGESGGQGNGQRRKIGMGAP
jgi:hypothetical protein